MSGRRHIDVGGHVLFGTDLEIAREMQARSHHPASDLRTFAVRIAVRAAELDGPRIELGVLVGLDDDAVAERLIGGMLAAGAAAEVPEGATPAA